MYTIEQINERVQAVQDAKTLVERHTEALLTAQGVVSDMQHDLLHALVENEKESYGIEQLSLTEYYFKALDATLSPIRGSAVASRTLRLIDNIVNKLKSKLYGLWNEEALALHIITCKTADDALENTATLDDRDLYVPLRKNLLDIIFEKAGADLYELADSDEE